MPVNSLLLIGVVIAASTPTTVSSNVVMTKNAHGNEASGKPSFRYKKICYYYIIILIIFKKH